MTTLVIKRGLETGLQPTQTLLQHRGNNRQCRDRCRFGAKDARSEGSSTPATGIEQRFFLGSPPTFRSNGDFQQRHLVLRSTDGLLYRRLRSQDIVERRGDLVLYAVRERIPLSDANGAAAGREPFGVRIRLHG